MRGIVVLFALAIAVTAAAANPYKDIRDTSVYCSNGLTCQLGLGSLEPPGKGLVYRAEITRQSGPNKHPELVLYSAKPFKDGSAVRFLSGGKEIFKLEADRFARSDDDWDNRLKDGVLVRELIAVLHDANDAEIEHENADGKHADRFSLSGFVGALRYMDEVQERLDTEDALEVKGPKPSGGPSVRDLLSVDDLPEDMKALFKSEGECEFFEIARFGRMGGFEAQLDDTNSLLVAPCGEGGAYNQPYALYAVTDLGFKRIGLPAMGEDGPVIIEEAWNIGWDHPKKELESFFKGRGLGDCGSFDRWKLINAGLGEPDFTLVEARVKDDCDGSDGGGIEKWPALWPPEKK